MTARPQLLGTATTVKEAIATVDDRTTFICLGVHGQRVSLDETFSTLNGDFSFPPFHWGCRTIVQFLIPGIQAADQKKATTEINRRFDDDAIRARRQVEREATATRPPVPISQAPVPPPDLPFTDDALQAAEKFLKGAKAVDRNVFPTIRTGARNTVGRLKGVKFRIKSSKSLARKITTEVAESGGRLSLQQALDKMTDVNRFTVQYDPRSYARHQLEFRKHLTDKGWKLNKDKNYWRPGPYRGHNTVWETPKGDFIEIQFHTRQSFTIKENVHKIYDKYRVISPTSQTAIRQMNTMTELSSRVNPPPGALDIGPAFDFTSVRIRDYLRRFNFF